MAMSKYTGGGGFSNYTSYYVLSTPAPRYDHNHARMAQWSEERRRRQETHYIPGAAGGAVMAFDEKAVKRRKTKDRSVKQRTLEEGAKQSSPLEEVVSVQCGEEATLPCRAPRPDSVDGLEWTRTDLHQYVYLFKDGEPDLTEQHQNYRGRCELKYGTSTLLLQNVTSADSGLYECRFVNHGPGISKRAIIKNDPVSLVRLRVKKTGNYTLTRPISYYVPPTPVPPTTSTPAPRYDHNHARIAQWSEERRRRQETHYIPGAAGGAVMAFDEKAVKRRKTKGHLEKRALEEGAEQSSPLEEVVSVQCGEEATLPCRAPRPDSVDGLEWTRTDLHQYVYLFKDGEPDLTEQHQNYRGRCELKDGTSTLLLQNVTSADSGLYECRFVNHGPGISKRAIIKNDPVSLVRLRVKKTGACAEAEEKEKEKEKKKEGKDVGKEVNPSQPPQGSTRHHYIVAGVVGVYGLVAVLITIVILAL